MRAEPAVVAHAAARAFARGSARAFARAFTVTFALALAVGVGCARSARPVETRPVTEDLAAYWTCAVVFRSDGHGADANEAFTFVPWLEGRLRERGVFDPLARDEGNEAEVTLVAVASRASSGGDDVSLRVSVLDTRTKAPLGELEAVGVAPRAHAADAADAGNAGDASESPRILAMRSAANQILDVLKVKRQAALRRPRPPPPAPLPDGPPVAGGAVCTTECTPPASSVSSHDEEYRVAAGVNPTMKELRECLDRVNAQLVVPAVLLRFSPDGQLRHMRVDVGGYEQLECIQQIRARLPRSVWTSRASLLRCEYRCTVS